MVSCKEIGAAKIKDCGCRWAHRALRLADVVDGDAGPTSSGNRATRDGREARESLTAICRMMVEEPFRGHQGKYFQMPPRNVIPKPIQAPSAGVGGMLTP